MPYFVCISAICWSESILSFCFYKHYLNNQACTFNCNCYSCFVRFTCVLKLSNNSKTCNIKRFHWVGCTCVVIKRVLYYGNLSQDLNQVTCCSALYESCFIDTCNQLWQDMLAVKRFMKRFYEFMWCDTCSISTVSKCLIWIMFQRHM